MEKKWCAMQMGKHGPQISHLMFADDLLLFGEASKKQMVCVMDTLHKFCLMSGQEISAEKYSILFSNNVSRHVRQKISHMSRFKETKHFGKYLDVQLSGKALKKRDYNYLVEKMTNRLANWKTYSLSFAGRVTLAKSVIEAIPTYPMATNLFLRRASMIFSGCKKTSYGGDTVDNKRYHGVNWDTFMHKRDASGLGLRGLQTMNKECLPKLI